MIQLSAEEHMRFWWTNIQMKPHKHIIFDTCRSMDDSNWIFAKNFFVEKW